MNSRELRQKYLNFFVKRGHKIIPSSPLVPENDATTLFVSSGMQPLVPYLMGEPHPLGKKLVDIQLCFRGQGIASDDTLEVGNTRHTTFFEMEGNWSLGSYFKEEQLNYFFTFLTDSVEGLGLDPRRLYVTVFAGDKTVSKDKESILIWQKLFAQKGINAKEGKRIFAYGVDKNWWSRLGTPDQMPQGEIGGPDSEVFYDFGPSHQPKFDPKCHPDWDCGRFLEIGNSVFMQYQKQADGSLKELKQKSVDFGGGLVRQLAATRDDPDIFKTDIYAGVIKVIEEITDKSYQEEKNRVPMRIVADHVTAASFLVKNGVIPANKGQGYVLRRLIRRALVKIRQLQVDAGEGELEKIVAKVLTSYDGVYFDKEKENRRIGGEIGNEAVKFNKVLVKGLRELERLGTINGRKAFDLYQSYGFPWELTAELAREKGQKITHQEFKKEFKKHQELSRSASISMFRGGLQDQNQTTIKYHTATHLVQAALRAVLGEHIKQEGSNITTSRARFDFSHPRKLEEKEIKQVEKWVNQKIKENWPVSFEIRDKDEAVKEGATAFFRRNIPSGPRFIKLAVFRQSCALGRTLPLQEKLGWLK
ncbi:MAG: alanine--tRNA ligase [Candidatus Shapirobacteria bacterium]